MLKFMNQPIVIETGEENELLPEHIKPSKKVISPEKVENALDDLPESEMLRMRMSCFKAILEEIIEDKIEEQINNDSYDPDKIQEDVEPMVDKAADLHLIPRSMKNHIQSIIASKMRMPNSLMGLYLRAANNITAEMTEENIPEEECSKNVAGVAENDQETPEPDQSQDEASMEQLEQEDKDAAQDAQMSKYFYKYMELKRKMEKMDQAGETPKVPKEDDKTDSQHAESIPEDDTGVIKDDSYHDKQPDTVIEKDKDIDTKDISEKYDTPDDDPIERGKSIVKEDKNLPNPTGMLLRMHGNTTYRHRVATKRVMRSIAKPIMDKLLHDLRYQLPEDFKKKMKLR